MTEIKLPLADIMQAASLKAGAARSGVRLRASAPIKTDKDGARLFRDLLGAMAHGSKTTTTTTRADTIGAAVRPQTTGSTLTVAEKRISPSAIVDTDLDEVKDADEDAPSEALQSEITTDAPTWSPPPLVKVDTPVPVAHLHQQDKIGPTAKTGGALTKTDAVEADDRPTPVAKTPSQAIDDLHSALSAPATAPTSDIKAAAVAPDAPTFESVEAVEFRNPAPAKVTVVSQETHLAPALMSSPVQQVVDVVQTELPGLVEQTAAARVEPTQIDVSQSPVKILTVRLDPPALGEVTVTMRLQGDGLELHLVAAQRDTTQMLLQQRELLQDLIRDIGYVTDVASVQQADAGSVQVSTNAQQLSSGPGQQDTSAPPQAGEFEQRASREQAGARDSGQERQQWSQKRDENAPAQDEHRSTRGRAVYL